MTDSTYNAVIEPDILEGAMTSSGSVNDEIDILRNRVFDFAAKEWDTSVKELEEAMEMISYHETGRTLSPESRQVSGPAGGLYHFEQEPSEDYPKASGSANDAQTRMLNFLTNTTLIEKDGKRFRAKKARSRGLNYSVDYVYKLLNTMSDDFSQVDRRLQDVAFLSHYLEHPSSKSNLGKALKTEKDFRNIRLVESKIEKIKERLLIVIC